MHGGYQSLEEIRQICARRLLDPGNELRLHVSHRLHHIGQTMDGSDERLLPHRQLVDPVLDRHAPSLATGHPLGAIVFINSAHANAHTSERTIRS